MPAFKTAIALPADPTSALHAATKQYADGKVTKGDLVVNVKDHGAVGNGSTDDTTAIQNAINASSAGATIYFPAGTYLINAPIRYKGNRRYIGGGWSYSSSGPIIKLANSANITATGGPLTGLFVPDMWYTNQTVNDDPVVIDGLGFEGNKANNASSTACGIILCNYWSQIRDCLILNTPKHGIHLTDVTQDGSTEITNSASENRLIRNRIGNVGGHGISQVCANGISNMDGFCNECLIDNPGQDGINFERASGWSFLRNHIYPNNFGDPVQNNGMVLGNCYATFVIGNQVESFGDANAASTFYTGIDVTCLDGRASQVIGNLVGANEAAGTATFQYLRVVAGVAQTDARAIVVGNACAPNDTPTANGLGLVLDSNGGGGILTATCGDNIITGMNTATFVSSAVKLVITDVYGYARPLTGASTAIFGGAARGTGAPTSTGTVSDLWGTVNVGTGTGTTTGVIAGIDYATDYPSVPPVTISPGNSATAELLVSATSYTWGIEINVLNPPLASQSVGTYVFHYRVHV